MASATAQALYNGRIQALNHTGPDGSDVGERTTAAGLRWSGAAENIAEWPGPAPTGSEIVNQWINHPPHRANLLGAYTLTGSGVGLDPYGRAYVVADYARE